MNTINLVFITDNGFALLTGVAIYSLKKNSNPDYNYKINIICSNVDEDHIKRFEELKSDNFVINIMTVDGARYEALKKENLHVSTTALFKFDLANLFPHDDKILYIDGDVLIQSDLVSLYNTDIENVYAGVTVDYGGLKYPSDFQKRLKIKHKYYFNSGMMLLNLSKIRKDGIPEKLVKYRIEGINFYMDQDALNVVFKEKVKYLSLNDNFVITCWRNQDESILTDFFGLPKQEKMIDYLNSANIVHYASADKPSKYYDVPHASRWYSYYVESPYKDYPISRSFLKKQNPSHVYFTREELENEDTNKTDTPSISVIIPCYNSMRYITRTMSSVLSQSLKNIEIICVDDGSDDGTYENLLGFAEADPRVVVVRQNNQFAGVARNTGIKRAKGDYLVFLDSDDQLREGALMKLYTKALNAEADIVLSKAFSLDDKTKKVSVDGAGFCLNEKYLPKKDVFCADDIPEHIFNLTGGNPWAKIFKRSFVEKYELDFLPIRRSEDFYFVMRALVYAKRIAVVKERLVYYRINNSSSLESTKDQTPLIFWEASMMLMDYLKKQGIYEKYEKSFLNNILDKVVINFKHVNNISSLEVIYDMIKNEADAIFDFSTHKGEYWYNRANYDFIKYLRSIDGIVKYFNDIIEENRKLKLQIKELKSRNFLKEGEVFAGKPKLTIGQKIKLAKKRGFKYVMIRLFRGRKAGDAYLDKNNLW